ncbi:flagellar basal body P-ring formation chaperone FlgA [Telmatospirillum siberiense]|uniref:Flagella basal body P-ring formation protein FlgA n=1 Tax=Telmatospirillum siberiense TaxID=382514 RepID=A0A2N3Q027_9PROT|nr:flagellar basal body P-ring formation chaperone FlgA [Telmatospirillum siberiense]PKU26010.1 flagella basal body P-ring formation protein FlgA [Telmatospirillum siberiense]
MNRALLPLAFAFSLVASSAYAGALLRPNVVVDGEVLKLGDLFDNVGAKAEVAIARSPAPGRRATLDADWLQRVAMMNGLDWRPQNAFEQAVVERAGVTLTHDQIEAELLSALAGQGVAGDCQIELANRAAQIVVPVGVDLRIGVRDLFYDSRYKRFTATVEVPANSPSATRLRVTGRVFQTIDIPVLNRQATRGDVITQRDLTWMKMREDVVRRDVAIDPTQIVGMTPRQTIRSGQMVSTADLQKPVAVARGALVTMVLKYGSMSLSTQGHAVEQGSVGDLIRVTNSHSNLTVEGRIEGPNVVSVSLNGATALAN